MNYYDEGQEQYEEIAIQAIDNMPLGAVIDYSGNDVPVGWEKINDYSTTETNTGKTWTDGSTIYRLVIEITDTNNTNQWKNYTYATLGIPSNATNMRLVELYKYMTQAGAVIQEDYLADGYRLQNDMTNKRFSVLGNGITYDKYIFIIEYTKSS